MALEPEMPGEQQDDTELSQVRRKFWIALALSMPVVVIAMLPHLFERGRKSAAIRQLLGLAPKSAHRVNPDGTEQDVPLQHVRAGDQLRVRSLPELKGAA